MNQKYALNLQAIAYDGTAPMIADMLSNQIPAGVGSVPEFIENHRAGRIRVLAMPDVHDRLTFMGFTVGHMTSQEFAIRERAYTQTWARIIKASGFQAQ